MESSHTRQGSRVRFAEEEPGLEVYHPQPIRKTRAHLPPATTAAAAASAPAADAGPGVYWADDVDSDPNASKYTFYREGTPTPPEYEEQQGEKSGFAGFDFGAPATSSRRTPSPLHHATVPPPVASRGNPGGVPPFDPGLSRDFESQSSDDSRDGELPASKKRQIKWIIIVLASLFIIVPIAIGTGLGVGLRKPESYSPEAADGSSADGSTNSTTTSHPTSSPTSSSSTSSSVTSSASPTPTHVASNNTLYYVPGSTKTFLQVCGIDYSGNGEATDLTYVYTGSMADCMNTCATYDKCTGCGWGPLPGDLGPPHRCWLKKDLRGAHEARDDYCFGILQM